MAKQGQVTVFIILGIVLILIFLIIYYIAARVEVSVKPTKTELMPVRNYVQACLDTSSKEAIRTIGFKGGYSNPAKTIKYNSVIFTLYDSIPKQSEIEESIAKEVLNKFNSCFNEEIIENIGFDIKIGEKESLVNIYNQSVFVKLNMPISLEKTDYKTELSEFSSTVNINLIGIISGVSSLTSKALNQEYNIIDDCADYNKNRLTKIITQDNLVKFTDYGSHVIYGGPYLGKAFIFQFAVEGAKITGECT